MYFVIVIFSWPQQIRRELSEINFDLFGVANQLAPGRLMIEDCLQAIVIRWLWKITLHAVQQVALADMVGAIDDYMLLRVDMVVVDSSSLVVAILRVELLVDTFATLLIINVDLFGVIDWVIALLPRLCVAIRSWRQCSVILCPYPVVKHILVDVQMLVVYLIVH